MSRIVPQSAAGKVSFFTARALKWAENAVAMGSSPERVALLAEQTEAARAAFTAQREALGKAQAATLVFHLAVAAMNKTGTDIIKQVKAKAAADGEAVYVLASLPAPAAGGPLPPPGTPDRFTADLRMDGSLALAWTCKNPRGSAGTLYQVARQVGSGAFEVIGTTGRRTFIDQTLPAAASVTYQVIAMRSTASGQPARYTVKLGRGGAAARVAA